MQQQPISILLEGNYMNISYERPNPEHHCYGCHYWRSIGICYACHYLLVTGQKRGCRAGHDCVRRIPYDEELLEREREMDFQRYCEMVSVRKAYGGLQ